jgi:TolB-like protein
MATGRRPFAGPTPAAIKEAVLCSTPEPPSASNAGLPPGFAALVARALEKDRALRYQTAADLAADLARLKRDAGERHDAPAVAAGAPDVRPALAVERPEAPEPRIAGRRPVPRWIWAAAAGVVLVAAGLGLWSGRWGDLPGRHRAGPRIQSLAVLPLENLSRDPDQQYFTDGMTEALITNLSGIRALRVISRTSSTRASQGAARRLSDIARILDVDAIVEGTVVRADGRVRISARLIDTASDRSVWANAYERDFRDVLRLQADVARAVADEIGGRLGGEPLQVAAPRPVDPKAYELYLKGRYFLNLSAGTFGSDAEEGWKKAIDYFNRAIRVDDRCAPAWAGLADSYYQLSSVVLPPDQAIPDARAAAARALEIDDTLAEAHTSLGVIKSQYDWDRAGAERELTRAIALNPNYAAAHQYLGMYYYADGRFTEALAAFEKAKQIDPLSFFIAVSAVWPLPNLGRYDEAIGQLEQVVELHPEVPDIAGYLHELRGEVLLQRGQADAAVAELLQGYNARAVIGDSPAGVAALQAAFARGGIRGYWQKQLDLTQRKYRHDLASASHQPQPRYISPFQVARLLARLGEKEAAFAVLADCLRSRDESLLWLKAESLRPDSTWTSIRSDPRFAAILRRVGLTPPDFSSGALAASSAKAP